MNGGVCVECGKPFGELHRTGCPNVALPHPIVSDEDCKLIPEPPQQETRKQLTLVPGLTKVGVEFFNLPAIDRQLQYECQNTPGGSEKNFIRLLRRLVKQITPAHPVLPLLDRQVRYDRMFAIVYGKSPSALGEAERQTDKVFWAHEATVRLIDAGRLP